MSQCWLMASGLAMFHGDSFKKLKRLGAEKCQTDETLEKNSEMTRLAQWKQGKTYGQMLKDEGTAGKPQPDRISFKFTNSQRSSTKAVGFTSSLGFCSSLESPFPYPGHHVRLGTGSHEDDHVPEVSRG